MARPRALDKQLLPFFMLSGACGLCFEILWARQLQIVVGATSKAVTAVVGVFMLGLALGNGLGARWALRVRNAAVAYGASEIAIGCSAFAVTALLPRLGNLADLNLRYLLAALLLLVPSTLMGLTFPFVMQASDPRARAGGGALYGANTAGAALGCLLTGFVGIGLLGLGGSANLAAVCNLVCGTAVVLLFRRAASMGTGPGLVGDPASIPVASASATRSGTAAIVLVAAGLAGASALAAEILWTRMLLPYLSSSSYAFSVVMASYLLGISLGSAWVATRCGRLALGQLALLFGVLQLGLAVLLALSPRMMAMAESLVPGYAGIRRLQSLSGWLSMVAVVFGKSALVLVPPTFLMGASLPLGIAMLARVGWQGGKAAGLASAVNTIGCVLGSLLAGFVLLPHLGSAKTATVAGLGNLAAAALTLLWLASLRRRTAWLLLLGAVAATAGLRFADRPPFLGRLAAHARVLLIDEGPQDTTAIIERPGPAGPERTLLSNGVSYAGDAPDAQRYMALLAHLPVLWAEDPSQAMVICVGTGTTAGNLALYDEIRGLDLVDISPAVHRTLPLFSHVNGSVWTDPRTTIHEADGRQFMTRTRTGYGVITLEPPPPRAAGAASLYTTGLYQRTRASLLPGGIIAQWLPLHGMTEVEILMLARTFLVVFPEAALFILNPVEAALLGSPRPLVYDVDRAKRRLQDPRVKAALSRIGFVTDDPTALATDILALAPVHGPWLRALVGAGPIVTDDHPIIEQFATLLTEEAQRSFDPDGRRGFLRRVLATSAPALPARGAALPGLEAARMRLSGEIRGWLGDKP